MRIGVYFGRNIQFNATSGGAFTFQQSILNVLKKYQGEHEFFIFSDRFQALNYSSCVSFLKLQRFQDNSYENFIYRLLLKFPRKISRIRLEKRFGNALNKSVVENKIELMWFVTPAFEFVSIPYIYTIWDLQHRLQGYFPEVSVSGWKFEDREKRYGFAILRASYIVIGNQVGKKEIIQFYGFPKKRIKIIPLPVSDFAIKDFAISKINNQDTDLKKYKIFNQFLFYPAQFWPHKNHISILLALKILREKYNLNFDVVFTGSDKGNLKYIQEKTVELGLQQCIHFLNFVSVDVLTSLYRKAYALIFPSFFGPDNIPPLEAFALECPVIAAEFDGARLQLQDAALFFNPEDEGDLANKIRLLYRDKELRKSMIGRGKSLVKNYLPEVYFENILKIIDEFKPIRRCWSSDEVYVHK